MWRLILMPFSLSKSFRLVKIQLFLDVFQHFSIIFNILLIFQFFSQIPYRGAWIVLQMLKVALSARSHKISKVKGGYRCINCNFIISLIWMSNSVLTPDLKKRKKNYVKLFKGSSKKSLMLIHSALRYGQHKVCREFQYQCHIYLFGNYKKRSHMGLVGR